MSTRRVARVAWLAAVVSGLLIVLAAGTASPAHAGVGREHDERDERIVLSGNVLVDADEQIDVVVIFHGDAVVEGRVDGDVMAFNGDIEIDGRVDGSVVALNGRVVVGESARVDGDVLSSEHPEVHESATVDGEIREIDFSAVFKVIGAGLWILWWIAVTVSTGVLGIVLLAAVPAAVRTAGETARRRPGVSIGWGFGIMIGLPIASGVAFVTIVGIPLGLLGVVSLVVLAALGYVLSMYVLGRVILTDSTNPYLAFLLGWIIVRLVGGVPVLGGLVAFATAVFGMGAIAVAGWRAARGDEARPGGGSAASEDAPLHPF